MSYSPTLGRFVQPDPIGYADGNNVYQFVHDSPEASTDPTGLADTQPSRTIREDVNQVSSVRQRWDNDSQRDAERRASINDITDTPMRFVHQDNDYSVTAQTVLLEAGELGNFDWQVMFRLNKPAVNGGYLVQKIEYTKLKFDVGENDALPSSGKAEHATYWEAWKIEPGKQSVKSDGKFDDHFWYKVATDTEEKRMGCGKGVIEIKGTIAFYETNYPSTWIRGGFPILMAGDLPTLAIEPSDLLMGTEGKALVRTLRAEWDYSKDRKTHLTVTNGGKNEK